MKSCRTWLKTKPSELFERQVWVGSEPFEDGLFELSVEHLGSERSVLATDSPHGGSSQPGQVTDPISASPEISHNNKRKLLGENAFELLDLGLWRRVAAGLAVPKNLLLADGALCQWEGSC